MSTTALEIDTPQLGATQLVARPGTLPTVTFPMLRDLGTDVAGIWEYLSAPADFFAVPMPGLDELDAAIAGFAATVGSSARPTLAAVSVTIAEAYGAPQILVSGQTVTSVRRDAVRIAGGDSTSPAHHSTDPWWRRMAARTTSRGDLDQLERWLNGRGFADAIAADVPLLGALVVQSGDDVVGVENPEPTSILDQLERCGAISALGRIGALPAGAERAWWISPRYETHPVAEVDGTSFPADTEVVPPFTRWS